MWMAPGFRLASSSPSAAMIFCALHLLRQVRFPPFHRASVPSSPWRLAPPAGDFLDSLLAWGKWRNPWLNAACGLGFEYQGSLARTLPPWVLGGFFRKIG